MYPTHVYRKHMNFQIAPLRVSLFTQIASVQFDPQMNVFVLLHLVQSREFLGAKFTGVWLFAGMHPYMLENGCIRAKGTSADMA